MYRVSDMPLRSMGQFSRCYLVRKSTWFCMQISFRVWWRLSHGKQYFGQLLEYAKKFDLEKYIYRYPPQPYSDSFRERFSWDRLTQQYELVLEMVWQKMKNH